MSNEMSYDLGQPFIQVTFPSRGTKSVLFRRENVRQVEEIIENGKPLVLIFVKSKEGDNIVKWYFDGTMEDFLKATKTIYL